MKKHVTVLLVIVISLHITGCMLPMIEDDRMRTVTEAALSGGAAGTIIGGLIGEILNEQPILGAIVGGIVGAAGGAAYGNHVANKKAEFASQEAYLDMCIMQAQQIVADTNAYNRSLRQGVQQLNQEVNALVKQYEQRLVEKTALERKQDEVQQEFTVSTERLKRVTDELLIQQEVRRREEETSPRSIVQLDAEIQRLQHNMEELGQYTYALASINQRLS